MKNSALPITSHAEVARALEIDSNPNASVRFHCTKCKHDTSGVFLAEDKSFSQCPACQSVLIYCPVCCRTASSTTKYRVTRCDACSTDFVTDKTISEILKRDRESVEIVLSGIRATGQLHLGNFFGAVRNFVKFEQGNNLCLYFIADWHTLTTLQDAVRIHENVMAVATDYLAAGLNPERSIIYAQSSVPEIAELALYLSMFQGKNVLEDLPTVKDLVRSGGSMSLGHLGYPVLMAADILGPQATVVPVGSDQRPNLEIARDLANAFNRRYGQTFVVPKMAPGAIKIPGLQGGKMGKSDSSDAVQLTDSLDGIARKYARAMTDPGKINAGSPGNPGNCAAVFPVYEVLLQERPELLAEVSRTCADGSRGCRDCKSELSRELYAVLGPFQERRRQLAERQGFVKEVLHYGGITAREMVQRTLLQVREKLGISPF